MIPKAIRLPSIATWRPRLLAGMSSETHRGVVAVLKPFPQPLDTSLSLDQSHITEHKLLATLPHNSTNDHLRHAKGRCLQRGPDEHERRPDIHALLATQHLANEEHGNGAAEASDSTSYVNGPAQQDRT